ncbi:STM3941 family protein [Sediminibacterium sp.]|uniref:STM3941 family protein n=1 Tax=Sediminibacterium sp. TaxID=1917865 RepID=UPI003F70F776
MMQEEQIEIPLSKKKLVLILFGAISFVLIGLWFLINPPISSHQIFGLSSIYSIVGFISVLFFGLVAVAIFPKISDKKAGIIINSQGIIDNSSGVSAGLVSWKDIQEIKVAQVMNEKFLMLIVKNPQDYIAKIKNTIKRKGMEINYKTYGSPISISASALKINFDELHKLLVDKMEEYSS